MQSTVVLPEKSEKYARVTMQLCGPAYLLGIGWKRDSETRMR